MQLYWGRRWNLSSASGWLKFSGMIEGRRVEDNYRRLLLRSMAINQIALVPYGIAGVTLMLQGFAGLYWLAPALLLSFVKAILDSWVLLVEIDR